MTTSLDVAKYFDKRHDHVLRDIRSLEVSDSFRLPNFGETSYPDQQGKERPMYYLTKDGFIFLVMGFTGEKAAQIKEVYITAFNQMEARLTRQNRKDLLSLLATICTEAEQLEKQHKALQEKYRRMYECMTRETVEMVSKVYKLSHAGFSEQEIIDITHYQKEVVKLALNLKSF